MPFQTTLGSLSSSISKVSTPIGGYYFGTKTSYSFNDMAYIGTDFFTVGKNPSNVAYISKFNEDQLLTWTVTLQQAGETTEFINVSTFNNYLYVFGYATSAGTYYPIVAKYDANGTLIWQRKIDGISTTFQCMKSGVVDINGNMYLALQLTQRTGTITLANVQSGSASYCAVKMLESGSIEWQTKLGYNRVLTSVVVLGTTYYYWYYWCDLAAIKIQVDTSGNAYVLSSRTLSIGVPGSTTSPPPNPSSLQTDTRVSHVAKFDTTGALAWQRNFYIGQDNPNVVDDMFIDINNNLYICGKEFQAVNNNTSVNLQTNGGFIVKINISNGNIIWHLDMGPNAYNSQGPFYGSSVGAEWKSMASDGYGNLYVVGTTFTSIPGSSNTSVIVKVFDTGFTAPTSIIFSNQYTGVTRVKLLPGRLSVTNGTVLSTWSFNGGYPSGVTSYPTLPVTYAGTFIPLTIYDMTGGSNPGSYWRVIDTFYTSSVYSALSSSSTTLTTGTASPTQTLVYFK